MKRLTHLTMALVVVTCYSQAWLGTVAPAQAATVIDRFEIKGTVKEWCQGNPKFSESNTLQFTDGALLTITRDVNGDGDFTDISATFGLNGGEADVIPMEGRALPGNKSGSIAQLALSGRNPGNPDHFITIRGQATFDKLGNLTRVTGTFGFQITDTYSLDKFDNQSAAVNCFGSGIIATGKKVTSVGGGMLTVLNAPASVGGTFVADPPLIKSDKRSFGATVAWGEVPVASPFHNEILAVGFNSTHHLVAVVFAVVTLEGATPFTMWQCGDMSSCAGVTIDRITGTASFTNTVLTDSTDPSPPPPITLNGTMTFTPF